MRIAILWSSLASYSVAFFRELAKSHHCKILLIYHGPKSVAPYKIFDLSFCTQSINFSENSSIDISHAVSVFRPDCLLLCSWNFPDYMKIAKTMRRKGTYVVSTIDHQWEGRLKQWLGVISSRWFLKPRIDGFLVAGDRQANFARRLGYRNILYGLYAATVEKFRTSIPLSIREPSFLFVGRIAPEKGVKNLLEAYRIYRQNSPAPWTLKIVGTGEMGLLTKDTPGLQAFGFVEPGKLPEIMYSSRALILPSLWEPWGVVIHEAAAAGLPIIATYACGAVTAYVREGINGFIIESNPVSIKDAMVKIAKMESDALEKMGEGSKALAELWTPRKLAYYFFENINSAQKAIVGHNKSDEATIHSIK